MTITLKITKKRVLIGLLVLAAAAAALTTCQMLLKSDAVSAFMQKGPRGGSEEERQSFIALLGYEVDPEPAEVVEIKLPKKFDDVYAAYDQMQREQGFNLQKYAGKQAKRYTYVVHNYPGYEGGVRLNLVVQSNRVIAGDVCSLEKDGFMHGFVPPTGALTPLGAAAGQPAAGETVPECDCCPDCRYNRSRSQGQSAA